MSERKAEKSKAISAETAGRIVAEVIPQLRIEMLKDPLHMWHPGMMAKLVSDSLQKVKGGENDGRFLSIYSG